MDTPELLRLWTAENEASRATARALAQSLGASLLPQSLRRASGGLAHNFCEAAIANFDRGAMFLSLELGQTRQGALFAAYKEWRKSPLLRGASAPGPERDLARDCLRALVVEAGASEMRAFSQAGPRRSPWITHMARFADAPALRLALLLDPDLASEAEAFGLDQLDGTPLAQAAASGAVDCCQALVEHGAQVNPKTWSVDTAPLARALKSGRLEAFQWLLERGARFDKDFEESVTFRSATAELQTWAKAAHERTCIASHTADAPPRGSARAL